MPHPPDGSKPLIDDECEIYNVVLPGLAQAEEQVKRDHALDIVLLLAMLIAALKPVLAARAEAAMEECVNDVADGEGDADFSDAADEWADAYARQLAQQLVQRTQDLVNQAHATATALGWDDVAVLAILARAFGDARARTIAVTENSVAVDAGMQDAIARLIAAGFEVVSYWQTAEDEWVCYVCGAMDGLPEDEWGGVSMPPHPNCRCRRRVEVVRRI